MHRRALLATTTSIGLATLAGCASDETSRPKRVTLEIDTEDAWSGTTNTDDGTTKISGRGGETLEWTQPLPSNIRVSLKKGPRHDEPLEATFYADTETVRSKSTAEPYDSIIITHTPATG